MAAQTGVLANDTSGSGSPLTARVSDGPAHGTLTLNGDGSFSYTPAADYSGPDAFSYTANDGANDSVPATVSLTVTPRRPPWRTPTRTRPSRTRRSPWASRPACSPTT